MQLSFCFAGNTGSLSSRALASTQRNVCAYPVPLDAQQIPGGMINQTRALHTAGITSAINFTDEGGDPSSYLLILK